MRACLRREPVLGAWPRIPYPRRGLRGSAGDPGAGGDGLIGPSAEDDVSGAEEETIASVTSVGFLLAEKTPGPSVLDVAWIG